MPVIDLSHTINNGMPVFPGSVPVEISRQADVASDGFNELLLKISGHTGTHIDCGRHLFAGGRDLASIPAGAFTGKGFVIDCRNEPDSKLITVARLKIDEPGIREADFVLFLTGWSRYWNSARYFESFPVLNTAAADYLASFPIKGVGVDTPGFDTADSLELANHKTLLSKGIILIENLTNLEALPKEGFMFNCFPLKINNGDGSPVRAVGIV
jgi:kynurenine formamidase